MRLSESNIAGILCWNERGGEIWLWLDFQWVYDLFFNMIEWEPLNNFEKVGNVVWFAYAKEHFGGICGELTKKQQRYCDGQAFLEYFMCRALYIYLCISQY